MTHLRERSKCCTYRSHNHLILLFKFDIVKYVLHFDNKLVKFNSQINIKVQRPPGRDEILMVRYLSSFYKGWYDECQACLRICSHVIKFRHVMQEYMKQFYKFTIQNFL